MAEQAAAAAEAGPPKPKRGAEGAPSSGRQADEAVTVPTPVVTPTNASGGPVDETAKLPRVPDEDAARRAGRSGDGVPDAEVTTELPRPQVPQDAAEETAVLPPVPPGAADETAVLPPVPPGAADETAVLPPVRDDEPGPGASDGGDDRTRELPQVGSEHAPRRRLQRSDWAEETPLDDLPTLADELLGPRDEEPDDEDDGGRGRGRRRGR